MIQRRNIIFLDSEYTTKKYSFCRQHSWWFPPFFFLKAHHPSWAWPPGNELAGEELGVERVGQAALVPRDVVLPRSGRLRNLESTSESVKLHLWGLQPGSGDGMALPDRSKRIRMLTAALNGSQGRVPRFPPGRHRCHSWRSQRSLHRGYFPALGRGH